MSVEQNRRITDFSPDLYLDSVSARPLENVEQIREDLWTLWAEYDLRPSPIRLFVQKDRLQDKYGNDIVLQAEAASLSRQGRLEHDRVEAEVNGVKQLRELLLSSGAKNGVIYLSPPGTREEGFGDEGKRRLSFTYLYHMGKAGRIHFLAVPELEVPILTHFDRIIELVDQGATAAVAGTLVGDLHDRSLVAYPFLASDENALDELAHKMGHESLVDLWKKALEAKRLRGKVGEVITHAAEEIWQAHQKKDSERLAVLGEIYRGVVALLTGPGLDDVDNVVQYFDAKVQAVVGAKHVDRTGGTTHQRYFPYILQLQEFRARMHQNSYAMEVVSGGSCPGDRGLDLAGGGRGGSDLWSRSNIMMDIVGPRGDFMSSSETTSSSSIGKYTQYYDYKPGICAHCHLEKPYVAHPKSEDITCAGWCSDCEK